MNSESSRQRFDIDLQYLVRNCERENLAFTGFLQDYGILIAVDRVGHLLAVSHNVEKIGLQKNAALGKSIFSLFSQFDLLKDLLGRIVIGQQVILQDFSFGPTSFAVSVTAFQSGFFIHFEPKLSPQSAAPALLPILNDLSNLPSLYQQYLQVLAELLQYDHIMVYRFEDDHSGFVEAENQKQEKGPSYLHHRFPASDIPKIARDLYLKTPYRIIFNIKEAPVPLLSLHEQVLDLTHCFQRSVSPIHIEYLKNMGVCSSFSLPIVINKELWGLIACHSYQAHAPSSEARLKAVSLVNELAQNIRSAQILEDSKLQQRFDNDFNLSPPKIDWVDASLYLGLLDQQKIADTLGLCGFAVVDHHTISEFGHLPSNEVLEHIIDTFIWDRTRPIFFTDQALLRFRNIEPWPKEFGGILIIQSSFSAETNRWRQVFLGFRAEVAQSNLWAGRPEKEILEVDGQQVLHPRRSFATWKEDREGCSLPWTKADRFLGKKIFNLIFRSQNDKAKPMLS